MPAPTSTPAAARFQKLLTRYLELNKRNARELVAKKAKDAVIQFYKLTKEAAPSKGQIKQDVISRGWKVKRPKRAYPYRKGEKRGSKGPLNRMRAGVIGRRQKAIGFVASGWLPAMNALGAKASASDLSNFRKPKGRVDIMDQGSAPGIAIVNSTPGCVAVDKKHQIIKTGLNTVSKDIIPYIRKKQEETSRALKT